VPYNFSKRFESEKGTNPEELVAAAHAACFSMALSLFMANENLKPESIDTTADVTFENVNGAWTVIESHLTTKVKSPGANAAAFQKAAEGAKAGCPISRLLNTKITLDAKLV
jgi:osmotically inducible protein OsmC